MDNAGTENNASLASTAATEPNTATSQDSQAQVATQDAAAGTIDAQQAQSPQRPAALLGDNDKPVGEEGGEQAQDQDNENKEGEGDKKDGAPESYEEFSLPEGFEVDAGAMDGFKEIAKNANLDQQTAQQFVDLFTQYQKQQAQKTQDAYIETINQWTNDTKADPEIGGKNLEQNLAVANKAIKAHFSPYAIELIQHFGLSNQPDFIRGFYKIGLQLKEGSVPRGEAKAPSTAELLYPSMAKSE